MTDIIHKSLHNMRRNKDVSDLKTFQNIASITIDELVEQVTILVSEVKGLNTRLANLHVKINKDRRFTSMIPDLLF